MKIYKNKLFWGIITYTFSIIISLGTMILVIIALLKYIFG